MKFTLKKTELLLDLLKKERFKEIAEVLCTDYYDLFYSDSKPESAQFDAVIDAENLDQATLAIAAYYEAKNHQKNDYQVQI